MCVFYIGGDNYWICFVLM